jgi:GT2 family glycosyltransferase
MKYPRIDIKEEEEGGDGLTKKVSIVIPCRNEKGHLAAMLQSFKITRGNWLLDLTIVDDGSDDGGCDFLEKEDFSCPWPVALIKTANLGPARARNLGAQSAQGEVLLFCDAHLIIEDMDWIEKMLAGFREENTGAVCPGIAAGDNTGAIGFGGTLDQQLTFSWLAQPAGIREVPIGPGGCIAIRREVFQEIGGFEENFPAWGFEDIEISIKMWLFGYRIIVNPEVKVYHVFRPRHPYPIKYTEVDYNLLWLAICHFNQKRLLKVVELVNARQDLNINLQRLFNSPVWEKSNQVRVRRKFDDDWYFHKFNISF